MPLPTTPGASNQPGSEDAQKRTGVDQGGRLPTAPNQQRSTPVAAPRPGGEARELYEELWEEEGLSIDGSQSTRIVAPVPDELPPLPEVSVEEVVVEQPSKAYQSIGELTSEQLINSKRGAMAHLQGTITQVTEWVQNTLREHGRTDDVIAARNDTHGEKFDEMVQFLDRLILKHISSDRSIVRSEDRKVLVAAVINEVLGLGPLEPLWRDTRVTEIMADGPDRIVVEIGGKLVPVPGAQFRDKEHLLGLCQQILGAIGRRVDQQHPTEDGRLPDKSRVNVVHNSIAPGGPYLTIRRHRGDAWTIRELVERKSFTEDMAMDLAYYIYAGCSTMVLGGTGSGKTTILNALSGLFPEDERIITIEDNLELQLHPSRLVVSIEARPASAGGQGQVTIRDLVRNSLRMRPNRIVVGEVRGAEAFDMLQAMNTGHNGSMTTFHANGADEGIDRLQSMVAQAGELDPNGVLSLIAGAVDMLVSVDRFPEDGSRRVSGVYEVPSTITMVDGKQTLEPIPLWEFVHDSTDPVTSEVIGHYEKMNEPSEALIRKHRLNRRARFTLDQVYEMSEKGIKG